MSLPNHRSEATGSAALDRIQNNVRQLVDVVRTLLDAQPRSVMLTETFSTASTLPTPTKLAIAVKAGECWDVTFQGRGSCSNVGGMGYALGAPPGSTVQGEHITPGWGRDFSDVTPMRGIVLGGGAQQLQVKVTVTPLG